MLIAFMDLLVQHIRNTVSITDEQLDLVQSRMRTNTVAKKEHVLQFEEYAKELFFTLSGCLRTYVTDYNGVEHNISFSVENWWSGDLPSFINQAPAQVNIQALEETQVLSINQAHWQFLLREVPPFVSYTRILFRNKMFAQQHRIVQNLSLTAQERYALFLAEYPNLSQRISQKHMASYLGITPEFLSMLRSKKKG